VQIVMLLPDADFDPTESSLPWKALRNAGHQVSFATPSGRPGVADPRLVTTGFGLLSPVLMTRPEAIESYRAMERDDAFARPLRYEDVPSSIDLLVVPGGHAPGMKTMLESEVAKQIVRDQFARARPVAAVCHGVLLLARAGVLRGRRTTALTKTMELAAWAMTKPFLGDYYRTYPKTVEDEVVESLARREDFDPGPLVPRRDTPEKLGFTVRDGDYVSARYPGDCHAFARSCVALVAPRVV
jgi:putative intracellular protease/amidase